MGKQHADVEGAEEQPAVGVARTALLGDSSTGGRRQSWPRTQLAAAHSPHRPVLAVQHVEAHLACPAVRSPLAIGGLVEVKVAAGLAVAALPARAACAGRAAQHAAPGRPHAARQLGSAAIRPPCVHQQVVSLAAGCARTGAAAGRPARDGDGGGGRLAGPRRSSCALCLSIPFVIAECGLDICCWCGRRRAGPRSPGGSSRAHRHRPGCRGERRECLFPGCRSGGPLALHGGRAKCSSGGSLNCGGSLCTGLLRAEQRVLQGGRCSVRSVGRCTSAHARLGCRRKAKTHVQSA